MLRLIHLSDIHLDDRRQLAGAIRTDADGQNVALTNTVKCVQHVIDEATDRGNRAPSLWLLTGDLFDRSSPSQAEERAAVELVEAMAQSAPVVIPAGNHDVPNVAAAATALECVRRRPHVHVVTRPELLIFVMGPERLELWHRDEFDGPPRDPNQEPVLALACLPYPRRAEFVRMAADASKEERYAKATQLLKQAVTSLRIRASDGLAARCEHRILAYHGTVTGCRVGKQPRNIASDMELHAGDLGGWDYVACGHIHTMQELANGVWYSGSIDRVDFAEEHDHKAALDVWLLDGDAGVDEVIPIYTPARGYVTCEPGHLASPPESWTPGVVYRVKAEVTPAEAVEIRRRIAELSAAGVWIAPALEVKHEIRTRDELATADESATDLLRRWLRDNPHHVEAIVAEHGGTVESVTAALLEHNVQLTGEA